MIQLVLLINLYINKSRKFHYIRKKNAMTLHYYKDISKLASKSSYITVNKKMDHSIIFCKEMKSSQIALQDE